MTRKDYEIIACILSYTEIRGKDEITTLLQSTNPKFDKERFWKRVWELQNGRV